MEWDFPTASEPRILSSCSVLFGPVWSLGRSLVGCERGWGVHVNVIRLQPLNVVTVELQSWTRLTSDSYRHSEKTFCFSQNILFPRSFVRIFSNGWEFSRRVTRIYCVIISYSHRTGMLYFSASSDIWLSDLCRAKKTGYRRENTIWDTAANQTINSEWRKQHLLLLSL